MDGWTDSATSNCKLISQNSANEEWPKIIIAGRVISINWKVVELTLVGVPNPKIRRPRHAVGFERSRDQIYSLVTASQVRTPSIYWSDVSSVDREKGDLEIVMPLTHAQETCTRWTCTLICFFLPKLLAPNSVYFSLAPYARLNWHFSISFQVHAKWA